MLNELRISNFVLIDHLHLEFFKGFQVLTGETGAGKSLLVDAVALLMGGRGTVDQIRSGAEEAVLEGAFSLPANKSLFDRLTELDLLPQDGNELIIRRILSRTGRNRLYVNGNLVPLHHVQELGGFLLDIHGQHEQQSLLSPRVQLDRVDEFGNLMDLRSKFGACYDRWRNKERELEAAVRRATDRTQREEFLRFQHQELEGAHLRVGEEEELVLEHRRLQHGGRLLELANNAYEVLSRGDHSVLVQIRSVTDALRELVAIDPNVGNWIDLSEGAAIQLRELADSVRDYAKDFDHDPNRLAELNERLAQLQRLKKKYGDSVEGLLRRCQQVKQELDELTTLEERTEELKMALALEQQQAVMLSDQLSKKRKRLARDLEKRIAEELAALSMERVEFRVRLSPHAGGEPIGPTGSDRVDYLFSANPGEPLQPLGRVASGGELSRLMLAIKTVLAEADQVPVLIFDEVDAGIGGAVAAVMGNRLRMLGRYHQVFCITHLPQVASQASTHFVVQKRVTDSRTVTTVKALTPQEREDEIARMLGGTEITASLRKSAAEMLRTGNA